MRKRTIIGAGVLGTALALTAGGVAIAGNGGDDGAVSHAYSPQQAEAATDAALEATGGGTANSVETDDENGATYEVEVTRTDGSTVDVRLDEQYQVVVIEGDGEE